MVGGVYADLPDKTDPQVNALINWRNDANTVGVLGQAFSEKRHLRRDGQEILGYANIDPKSPLAVAHPDLANVAYPTLIGSALFEQERERKGGLIDVQIRPTTDIELDFNAFTSKMEATNYNRNWMFWGAHVIGGANYMPSSYTVHNGTLVSADFPNVGKPGANAQYAIVDQISRPGTFSETSYFNVDGRFRLSDNFTLSAQGGSTTGKGETPNQNVFEGDVFNTGANYSMNGSGHPVDISFPSGNPSVFTGTTLDWIFGASPAKTKDKENYGQGRRRAQLHAGSAVEHQVRRPLGRAHPRYAAGRAGPELRHRSVQPGEPAGVERLDLSFGNFGSNLGGGNFPRQPWQLNVGDLNTWGDIHSNRDPVTRQYWPGEFALKEKTGAAYVMGSFEGKDWSGNVGVRFVQTKEEVTTNVAIPGDVCGALQPCPSVPGAITTSAFGSFYQAVVKNTYNDWLPSGNLKMDMGANQILRFAASRTMSRPDYSALGGAITADDTTHTGNGGNPNLKPITSNNFDGLVRVLLRAALVAAGGCLLHEPHELRGVRHLHAAAAQHPHRHVRQPTRSRRRPTERHDPRRGTRVAAAVRTVRHPDELHLRRRPGEQRGRPGGCIAHHVQRLRLLRGPRVQRAACVHLPLALLRGPGPQHAAVPGRHRHDVRIAQLHVQQELLDLPRRAELE